MGHVTLPAFLSLIVLHGALAALHRDFALISK